MRYFGRGEWKRNARLHAGFAKESADAFKLHFIFLIKVFHSVFDTPASAINS